VEIRTLPFTSVVDSRVSRHCSHRPDVDGRVEIDAPEDDPGVGGRGAEVSNTFSPVCRPTPSHG